MTRLAPTLHLARSATRVLQDYCHLPPSPVRLEAALSKRLGCPTFVKYEFRNPVRSFKIRGALYLLHQLTAQPENRPSGVATASTGNHGAAMALACQRYNVPLTVGVPVGCDQSKVSLIRRYGPRLDFLGRDLDEAKEILRASLPEGSLFIEDGSSPEIYAGSATIGLELASSLSDLEYVFVPVGNGALIGGLGTVLRELNPRIRILGVQSKAAPCMALSFDAGRPVSTSQCQTFASGMAVREAIPEAVEVLLKAADDVVLVSEQALKRAVGLFFQATGELVEGAGAAALAGALECASEIRGKRTCLIASGANADDWLKKEILADPGYNVDVRKNQTGRAGSQAPGARSGSDVD